MDARRFAAAAIVLVLVLAALPACDEPGEVADKGGAPAAKPPAEPAFRLTDEAFAKEFKASSKAAAKKYAGKWIELEGTVGAVASKNMLGQHVLGFKGATKETATGFDAAPVVCGLVPEAVKAATEVTVTQKVKVLGKYEEGTLDATLAHCRIVWTGPDPAIKVAAAKLAADHVADEKAADAKYEHKQVLVEGVVAATTKDEFGSPSLVLAGAKKDDQTVQVTCTFTKDAAERAGKVAKGQRVRVKGQCQGLLGKEVSLVFCVLLD